MPLIRPVVPLLLLVAVSAAESDDDLLGGTPAAASAPAAADNAESSMARAQARGLIQAGMAQVRAFNDDRTKNANAIVDAAIAFAQAKVLVEPLGDEDLMGEVQANLFWCKKQMDVDAIKVYLARKGEDGQVAVTAMDRVAELKVEASDAAKYFARAERFALGHTDDHLQVSIRYLEVAERFPGTKEGTEAGKRANNATQALLKNISSAVRKTRFTQARQVEPGSTPLPPADVQKMAIDLIRKQFAKDYLKKDNADKRRLARRLFDESVKNKSDAALYFALLSEAARLAQEGEDYERLLDSVEALGAAYAGYDVNAEKSAWLKKGSAKVVPANILRLLANPTDAAANLVVGKYFCFDLDRWAEGLSMLAMGADASLAKIADMESSRPQTAEEQMQVADAWYEQMKKTSASADKLGMAERANHWYDSCRGGVSGLYKDRVATRLDELDKMVPLDLDRVDWNRVTVGQWDKLKGKMAVVQGRLNRTDSQVELKAGERVRVVPHPTDQYMVDCGWWGKGSAGWRGTDKVSTQGGFPFAALLAWVGATGPKSNCGIMTGPGHIWLAPHAPEPSIGGAGQIRVKFVPVTE